MSLKYEPSSEPLRFSVKELFFNSGLGRRLKAGHLSREAETHESRLTIYSGVTLNVARPEAGFYVLPEFIIRNSKWP